MADLHPIRLWRRLLSLPNDGNAKPIAIAFVVSVICAVVVAGAAVLLRPLQEANRVGQQQARLAEVVASLPGMDDVLQRAGAGRLEALMVDLLTGRQAMGIDPSGFDMRAAAAAEETSSPLTVDVDLARIGRKPNLARIYVLRRDQQLVLVVLPIYGTGYQSTIHAYLALHGDLNTVAALKIVEHGETPGIGSKIEDPAWQQLWPGKQLADDTGGIRLAVVRGAATSHYEVDGITGATRSGNGISNMVRFWLGEHGYGPVLRNLRGGTL